MMKPEQVITDANFVEDPARREVLKGLGALAVIFTTAAVTGCNPFGGEQEVLEDQGQPEDPRLFVEALLSAMKQNKAFVETYRSNLENVILNPQAANDIYVFGSWYPDLVDQALLVIILDEAKATPHEAFLAEGGVTDVIRRASSKFDRVLGPDQRAMSRYHPWRVISRWGDPVGYPPEPRDTIGGDLRSIVNIVRQKLVLPYAIQEEQPSLGTNPAHFDGDVLHLSTKVQSPSIFEGTENYESRKLERMLVALSFFHELGHAMDVFASDFYKLLPKDMDFARMLALRVKVAPPTYLLQLFTAKTSQYPMALDQVFAKFYPINAVLPQIEYKPFSGQSNDLRSALDGYARYRLARYFKYGALAERQLPTPVVYYDLTSFFEDLVKESDVKTLAQENIDDKVQTRLRANETSAGSPYTRLLQQLLTERPTLLTSDLTAYIQTNNLKYNTVASALMPSEPTPRDQANVNYLLAQEVKLDAEAITPKQLASYLAPRILELVISTNFSDQLSTAELAQYYDQLSVCSSEYLADVAMMFLFCEFYTDLFPNATAEELQGIANLRAELNQTVPDAYTYLELVVGALSKPSPQPPYSPAN